MMARRLYLQVCVRGGPTTSESLGKYEWYVIHDSDGDVIHDSDGKVGGSIRALDHDFPHSNMCCTDGSVIYVLGGKQLWYHDTIKMAGPAWTEGPSMLISRVPAAVFASEGKIFVFGGFSFLIDADLFPEVYDIGSQEWDTIRWPLDKDHQLAACTLLTNLDVPLWDDDHDDVPSWDYLEEFLADGDAEFAAYVAATAAAEEEAEKQVFLLYFADKQCLCSYHLDLEEEGYWERLDESFGFFWKGPFVYSATSHILLNVQINDFRVFGYHLECKQWFLVRGLEAQGVLPPKELYDSPTLHFQILSLDANGDIMCVLWSNRSCKEEEEDTSQQPLCVHLTKFTVRVVEDWAHTVLARVLGPTKNFALDNYNGDLVWCLALGGGDTRSRGADKKRKFQDEGGGVAGDDEQMVDNMVF